MENKAIFQSLLEMFPNLKHELNEYEDEPILMHLVFGDVINPYIENCIYSHDFAEIRRIFQFIDFILSEQDIYIQEVILFTVLERFADDDNKWNCIKPFLGPNTLKLLKIRGWATDFENIYRP